jgi:hypothetical protein
MRLAIVWMNEEWYNDKIQAKLDPSRVGFAMLQRIWLSCLQERQYDVWLGRLASSLKARMEPKDKTFARFLMELPSVTSNVLSLCRELAETPQQYVSVCCGVCPAQLSQDGRRLCGAPGVYPAKASGAIRGDAHPTRLDGPSRFADSCKLFQLTHAVCIQKR